MKLTVLDGYCLNPGDLSWDALRGLVDVTVYDRTPAAQVIERMGHTRPLVPACNRSRSRQERRIQQRSERKSADALRSPAKESAAGIPLGQELSEFRMRIHSGNKNQTPNTKLQQTEKHQSQNVMCEDSFAVHGGEDFEQLGCFAIQRTSFVCQQRFGRCDHSEEEPGFLGFLDATLDGETEILL